MLAHIHPSRHSLLIGSAQEMPLSHVFRLCVLRGCSPVPAMTESPFAWLGALPRPGERGPLSRSALPDPPRSYGLMRQTSSLWHPLLSLWAPVFAGCCEALLAGGPSRRFSWCTYPLLPRRPRPSPTWERLGNTHTCRTATSVRGSFSGLQTFAHVQASGFARHPGRSYRRASSRLGAAVAFTSEHRTVCYLAVPRIC